MLVNCLLNCSVFCLFVQVVLLLKVIVMLGGVVGFLLVSPAMVFHSLCWSYL